MLSEGFLRNSLSIVGLFLIFSMSLFAEEQSPKQILITNVGIFDGENDELVPGNVLIENNLIKQVSEQGISVNPDAMRIDGGGRTLMPGLIDMHQHIMLDLGTSGGTSDWDAYTQGIGAYLGMHELLAQGVTTIRDIAGNSLGISKAVASGRFTGPRIYSSGPAISQTGGHGDWGPWNDMPGEKDYQEMVRNTVVVDGLPELSKAVRGNFRNGANFIKVFAGGGVASAYDPLELAGYTTEELKRIVDIANDYESYVCVHAYTDKSYNRALDAGVKCFEHGFLVSEDVVKRMAKTEGVFWSFQAYMSITAFAAPEEIPWFTPDMVAKAKQVHVGAINAAKLMKKHGVPTVMGSDMFAEQWPIAIENIMVPLDYGYTPLELLKASTSTPGKILTTRGAKNPYTAGPLGVIEEGAYADILIINGNPLVDLTILRDRDNLELIMKDGNIFKNTLVPPEHPQYTIPPRTKLDTSGL